ncbi:MAG TPA: Pycsar system effector family protein [Rhodothermales bacterium]|nr:Pycsar system effector family protein [Rhodothermales bacterium]
MKSDVFAPIAEPTEVVTDAAAFIYSTYKEKLPESLLFHTYQHAVDVASAAKKIAGKSDLDPGARARVELAALFHDTGYVESYTDHVDESVRIASGFLADRGVPTDDVEHVASLIRYVHSGNEPDGTEEAILHDANLAFAGRKKFFDRSERLRLEWERALECTLSRRDWAERQLRFLNSIHYATDYAQKKYARRLGKNVDAVLKILGSELIPEDLRDSIEPKVVPERGIETMFRTTFRTHITLSSIADNKAHLMITVNAILLSIIVSYVSTHLQTDPWLMIPSAALLLTSLVTIIFAILSTRPKVTSKSLSLADVRRNPKTDILFFGNFTNLSQSDFLAGVRELMADRDLLYDNLSSDLYALGVVLRRKYQLLWFSYTTFMAGLILSVALFVVFYLI